MKITRNYKYKDVEMLMAAETIVQSLSDNLVELSVARTNWDEAYVTATATQIDNAIENYLGKDAKLDLRKATAQVTAVQAPALRDLSFLKRQIEVDFGAGAAAMLKNLGFTTYLASARKGNQESLIELLYAYKQGLTAEIRAQIIANGTSEALLDRIVGYADQLKAANISQETLKATTKEVTEEAIAVFNDIYKEVIGICKIASSYYKDDKLKKEQFTFSKVVARMSAARKVAEEPVE